MVTGQDIVNQARQYLGVRYFHCGRDEHGLDCSGLILRVAHDLNLTDWDEVDYSVQVDADRMRAAIERFCEPVGDRDCQPQTGDVLWFMMMGHPQHVGFATEEGRGIIHCHQAVNRVVEHSFDGIWRRRLLAVFRWRGVSPGSSSGRTPVFEAGGGGSTPPSGICVGCGKGRR